MKRKFLLWLYVWKERLLLLAGIFFVIGFYYQSLPVCAVTFLIFMAVTKLGFVAIREHYKDPADLD